MWILREVCEIGSSVPLCIWLALQTVGSELLSDAVWPKNQNYWCWVSFQVCPPKVWPQACELLGLYSKRVRGEGQNAALLIQEIHSKELLLFWDRFCFLWGGGRLWGRRDPYRSTLPHVQSDQLDTIVQAGWRELGESSAWVMMGTVSEAPGNSKQTWRLILLCVGVCMDVPVCVCACARMQVCTHMCACCMCVWSP